MSITDLADDYLVDRKECLKKLTTTLLNEVMQQEAENQIQARPYERTGKRKAHRNGTRPRKLKTIHGEIELEKPQIREFPFETTVFERYSLVEESVRVAVSESYLAGVATRKVEKVFSEFGLEKSFPRQHWRRIRTTNGLERINKELKRRSRVSGAYSNDQSLLRVAVCIMMDINEVRQEAELRIA